MVVPLTTNVIPNADPLRIPVPVSGQLRRPSDLLIDQLRAIDNRRLLSGPLTTLSAALMRAVADAIVEVLELNEP
jgi:mRNA interferase MazF